MSNKHGKVMYSWAKKLFPITRSISSPGNKRTLLFLKKKIKNLKIKSFESDKIVYGWKIPKLKHHATLLQELLVELLGHILHKLILQSLTL